MSPRVWLDQGTEIQPYANHRGFNFTTTLNTAQTAVNLAAALGNGATKISFVVDDFDLYVEFDAAATSSSMIIKAGTGYSEDNVYIESYISVLRVNSGEAGKIRGIAWGR